jgi:hypothetical protein
MKATYSVTPKMLLIANAVLLELNTNSSICWTITRNECVIQTGLQSLCITFANYFSYGKGEQHLTTTNRTIKSSPWTLLSKISVCRSSNQIKRDFSTMHMSTILQ